MKTGKSILLVEDDLIDSMIMERALKENLVLNLLVKTENGEQALSYLFNSLDSLPCLILLDLNMPKMNGLEFLREIKREAKLCAIPVLVITTSNNSKDIKDSFQLGCAGYIVKPIDYNEFVENIKIIKDYWLLNQLPN